MNEHDAGGNEPREDGSERQQAKVTDRRRVRDTESAPASDSAAPETADPAGDPASDLERAEAKAAEYLDHLRRLQADFDNYRKRTIKEQTRAIDAAAEPLVQRLLEVLDEFELALMAAEKKPDFDKFLHGVELVYAKLKDSLASAGLRRIEAEGKLFDPEQHEALMQSGGGEGEPVVDDVLRQGYTLKGRVIRPAGVRVSRS